MRRILIDECIHPRLKERFKSRVPDFQVQSVRDLGWSGYSDQSLIGMIQGHYEVFVTLDRGFEFQQNLSKLDFGIVIVRAINNQMASYERMFGDLQAALAAVKPGCTVHVRDPLL